MKKILFYLLIFSCFSLSIWQSYRFSEKYKESVFLDYQDEVLNNNQQLFISKEVGDLYFWENKKYEINLNNNKIYRALENFADSNEKKDYFNFPLKQNLYFRNKICGKYLKNKAFVIYNPKDINNLTKSGYSVIVPLLFNSEIFLVKYFWTENINNAQLEVEKLNKSHLKSDIPEILNVKNDLGLCFDGILIDRKRYNVNYIISLFAKNNLEKNEWNNLNDRDLNILFNNEKISNFFLDTTINSLSQFKKLYKHHIFYSIMWFILVIYLIFLLKNSKKAIDIKKN